MKRVAAALGVGALVASGSARAEKVPERGFYVDVFGTAELGKGIRWNNPYRLQTSLGSSYESLSTSATYGDLGIGAALGPPDRFQHGAYLHYSFALGGIAQHVVAPTYLLMRRFGWGLAYAHVGPSIVLGPQRNTGAELAIGGAWLVRSGLGVSAELGQAAYYGAATSEVSATLVPVTYFQVGLLASWEVLP